MYTNITPLRVHASIVALSGVNKRILLITKINYINCRAEIIVFFAVSPAIYILFPSPIAEYVYVSVIAFSRRRTIILFVIITNTYRSILCSVQARGAVCASLNFAWHPASAKQQSRAPVVNNRLRLFGRRRA